MPEVAKAFTAHEFACYGWTNERKHIIVKCNSATCQAKYLRRGVLMTSSDSMSNSQLEPAREFPKKSLAASFLTTFAVLMWAAVSSYTFNQTLHNEVGKEFAFSVAVSRMTYLATDSVQAVKLLTSTGDKKWQSVIESDAAQIRKTIGGAKAAAPVPGMIDNLLKIEILNTRIENYENAAMALAGQDGKLEEARDIITSMEFARARQQFSDACRTLSDAADAIGSKSLW